MRKSALPIILFISSFWGYQSILAQVDTTSLFTATPTEKLFGIRQNHNKTDSLLDNIQNYGQNSIMGNVGLPSYPLLADFSQNMSFFKWMNTNNTLSTLSKNDPIFLYPGKIYTKVSGVMGQKQEQWFKIIHAQTIGKRLQLGLQFNRYSCFGFYNNQKALTDNLAISTNYQSKDSRWQFASYFIFNKCKNQLNGGITSDTAIQNANLPDKLLVPVNLNTAKQYIRSLSADFSIFYHLNNDTLKKETGSFLAWEGNFSSNYWVYADTYQDSSYYKHTYIFPAASYDSANSKTISNSLLYRYISPSTNSSKRFSFYAGYKNETSHYIQDVVDTVAINQIAQAGFLLDKNGKKILFNGEYVVAGYNQFNYQLSTVMQTRDDKSIFFRARLDADRQMPTMMSSYFLTNHFMWNHRFNDILTQSAKAEIASFKYHFNAGIFARAQQNTLYFDSSANPTQYAGNTLLLRYFISKDLKLGRIHFNNTINYQSTTNPEIIRLPTWMTFHQLYYEGHHFKNNLWLQCGFQARYISGFLANAFMPASDQFYLQNKQEYGNYIFIDFFINARIDNFSFFIKADHVNQGLTGYNYILCPGYPYPDRSFKFGIVWQFYN